MLNTERREQSIIDRPFLIANRPVSPDLVLAQIASEHHLVRLVDRQTGTTLEEVRGTSQHVPVIELRGGKNTLAKLQDVREHPRMALLQYMDSGSHIDPASMKRHVSDSGIDDMTQRKIMKRYWQTREFELRAYLERFTGDDQANAFYADHQDAWRAAKNALAQAQERTRILEQQNIQRQFPDITSQDIRELIMPIFENTFYPPKVILNPIPTSEAIAHRPKVIYNPIPNRR